MERIKGKGLEPKMVVGRLSASVLLAWLSSLGCTPVVPASTSSPDNATSISRATLSTPTKEPTVIILTPTVTPTVLASPTRLPTLTPEARASEPQKEGWITVPNIPQQYPEWFPLSEKVAKDKSLHTIDDSLVGFDVRYGTNFVQHAQDLEKWYFETYSNLDQIRLNTSGFCHGWANAAAYGEIISGAGDIEALALYTALHSGDGQYKPGIYQLIEDLVTKGRPFVIETDGPEGYWSRVVWAVNTERTMIKTTDFGRAPKVFSLSEMSKIKNAYYPVPPGEERSYPAGTVSPAVDDSKMLALWTFDLGREKVKRYLASR